MINYFIYQIKFFAATFIMLSLFTYTRSQNATDLSGTVKIENNIFFDKTEIDVGSWLSYYSWVLENNGFNEAQKVLPDSNVVDLEVWAFINKKSNIYIENKGAYTSQPIGFFNSKCIEAKKYGKRLIASNEFCPFIDFPITGLSYEQVIDFCKWRTTILGNNKTTFRLPTPEEWKIFALKGFSESEKNNGQIDSLCKKKCPAYNYKIVCTCDKDSVQGKLNSIGNFGPGKSKAFDVYGNVSEMTSVKGIAKGGNYMLHANQCHPDSAQHYSKPEAWLGFRCIIIKKIEDKNTDKKNYNEVQKTNKGKTIVENKDSIKWNGKYSEFIDSRDGKKYRIVKIGDQIWMAQNLAYKPDDGKFWVYQNEESNVQKFGYLYTWETAKTVCPVGWHLPQKEDFEMLLMNVGGSDALAYNSLIIYGSSGFSIVFCGLRYGINFTPIDRGTVFWSATEKKGSSVWGLGVDENTAKIYGTYSKSSGLPIRCIKDL